MIDQPGFLRALSSRALRLASAGAVLLAMFGVGATPAAAADAPWPSKPVRVIAVFPPGGSVDQVARVLSQQLTLQTGQQFIVDNRGGAAGSIGTAMLAKADPDGYTLGVVFDTHATNPALIPHLSYDTLRDLAPVVLVGTGALAIATHVSQPYKNFRDVIAAAKAKPGSVSYGSIGTGSSGHLAMAQIGNIVGTEFTHVPYRGGGPLMNDAISNQVPLAIGSVFLINPHVQSGRLRALAVTSAKRDPQMPGVDTVASQGVPGFEAYAWWGVYAPAKTPAPVIRRIVAEIQKALKVPAVAEKLTAQGIDITGSGPEDLDKFQRKEIARWAKVVRDNKIRAGE